MQKAVLIIPYFGKFPSFFQLFLNSCKYNQSFNWLFFTDDKTPYHYPGNARVIYTTFEKIKEIFQEKLGDDIVMLRPHKLCDYKVTYGFVFQEWISSYDYWGHGDVDVIYGNLNEFINPLFELGYDKIFSLGHFSLYKNTPEINAMFQTPINGNRVDKVVFASDYGFAFDEWHCPYGGINQIFERSRLKFYKSNLCANLNSKSIGFQLSNYDIINEKYFTEKEYRQIFSWERGVLKRLLLEGDSFREEAYPYIHFHKRYMRMSIDSNCDAFFIVPNEFIPPSEKPNVIGIIKRYSRSSGFNRQYLHVKYINLRYRLKQLLQKIITIIIVFV